ncbi:hypothetical protein Nepgr_009662 [Nepenthes gracilis]|uniref:Uncharacterized protein n=1 Tax=Nepenthes gracilis TaxID=150966 RepID=A0AAD3SB63_NEPGR|nr:hypothetical protein Nepgr_009662 [Nepenthes gracilis]
MVFAKITLTISFAVVGGLEFNHNSMYAITESGQVPGLTFFQCSNFHSHCFTTFWASGGFFKEELSVRSRGPSELCRTYGIRMSRIGGEDGISLEESGENEDVGADAEGTFGKTDWECASETANGRKEVGSNF